VVIVPPEGGLEFSAGLTKKIVFLFMSRLTNSLGIPFNIVIESRITHASSSSQEALLRTRKTAARGSREERERSQSVPLTLPSSYSLFLIIECPCGVQPDPHVWFFEKLRMTLLRVWLMVQVYMCVGVCTCACKCVK